MPATPAWPPKSLPRLFVRDRAGRRRERRTRRWTGELSRQRDAARCRIGAAPVRRQLGRMAGAHRRGGEEADDARRRAADARAGDDPGRLARLRAGQAGADGLAGREGDRARRRAADPGDDAADDCRTREARTAGIDRDRGRRAMRPDATCPRLANRSPLHQLLASSDGRRALYFADEGGGEPRRRSASALARH